MLNLAAHYSGISAIHFVYFWLLPAYIAWYVVVPKIIGTKVFSDSLARFSFVLFILFSIPVGFHHQLTEPGSELLEIPSGRIDIHGHCSILNDCIFHVCDI